MKIGDGLKLRRDARGDSAMATVLLVDDDVGLLGSVGILIAAEGHLVRTATNGGDALRLALESRPDIVVTDCAMAGMDGIALVRKLQEYPELASIPVILTSDARRRPHIKVYGFLRKPFPVTVLLRRLHRLARRPSRRGASAFGKPPADGWLSGFTSAAMRVRVRRAP
jgi:CheY-like chemotaxis protein